VSEFTSIAQALKEAGKRLRELESSEERTPDIGFCLRCRRDRIIIRKRCAHCQQLLVGSGSIPAEELSFGGNVAPWSPGDPGAPFGTVVAVDGDTVTVEIGEVTE
jgi:hypothetical protein